MTLSPPNDNTPSAFAGAENRLMLNHSLGSRGIKIMKIQYISVSRDLWNKRLQQERRSCNFCAVWILLAAAMFLPLAWLIYSCLH